MNECMSGWIGVPVCVSLLFPWDLLFLPVLIAPGEVCDRQNTEGLQAFLAFVLQVSELVELREFTDEVKGRRGINRVS